MWTQPLRKALGEAFFLATTLRGYSAPLFPILAYHSISEESGSDVETVAPDVFESQMAWLAGRKFKAVTVSELVCAMARPTAAGRVLAITFDDGYRDNIMTAFPVLQRYGFYATYYIPTAYIGGLSLWNPVDYIGHRPVMTDTEIRRLSDAGQEIGSHAHSHVDLTFLDDPRLNEELRQSGEILGDITGRPVVAVAPPHGRSNRKVAECAARLGYAHLVRGGRFRSNPKGASPYDLRRITIARGDSLREFVKKLSGAYEWLSHFDR